jgi:hypothetical protein
MVSQEASDQARRRIITAANAAADDKCNRLASVKTCSRLRLRALRHWTHNRSYDQNGKKEKQSRRHRSHNTPPPLDCSRGLDPIIFVSEIIHCTVILTLFAQGGNENETQRSLAKCIDSSIAPAATRLFFATIATTPIAAPTP